MNAATPPVRMMLLLRKRAIEEPETEVKANIVTNLGLLQKVLQRLHRGET